MKLKKRQSVKPVFEMASLTDIIFLLLIFFLLTSSFVTTNAFKLFLPQANAPTMTKKSIQLSVKNDLTYMVDDATVPYEEIEQLLKDKLAGMEDVEDPVVVLAAEDKVTTTELVKMMEIGINLNVKMVLKVDKK